VKPSIEIHPSHLFLAGGTGLRLLSESEDQSEQITNAKDGDPALGVNALKRFRRRDAEAGVAR
jgi:hypothetical protein